MGNWSLLLVIPAKAAIQLFDTTSESWIPACAGMTKHKDDKP
jgi:hypothetical protein